MGDLFMGGYAKINKNKIQPSPTLAALTGFLSGLNTKRKEIQDREDAQNKQAVDMFKYMQEQAIKERETVVKERGATSEEDRVMTEQDRVMTEQDRVMLEAKRIDQAQQTINDNLNKTALDYKKFHLDLMKSITDPTEKEKFEILQNNLQKGLEDYKESIAIKADERKQKLLVAGQISVETERQKGDIATQVMIQAGQDRINKEDNARMVSEGALNRINAKEIAMLRDSPDGKTPEFAPYVKAFDDYQNEVIYTIDDATPQDKNKNKDYKKTNITPVMQQRMDQKYGLLMDMYNKIPVGSRPTAPQRFTGSPAVLNWIGKVKTPSTYGYEGGTTAQPTKPLSSGELKVFNQYTTPAMIKQAKEYSKGNQTITYDSLIKHGVPNNVALKILDETYKEK